ncbi:hypothetical protein R3P38DRAFT_619075 [Favolaschia claudopus]|uniref:Taste receptor type 2 n=1 Tax=Favolaschia claudopus TaxID=2862362 RepID=A0AAW0CDQ5_9AGAR
MVAQIPRDKIALFADVFEAMFYGFSIAMYIITMWILLRHRTRKQINTGMVSVACLLFIFSTIHIAIDIYRINEGVFKHPDPIERAAWFRNPALPSWIFKNSVYSLQTILGDGVVVYRCYKVWGSIRIIILPSLLWISVVVTSVGSIYSVSRVTAVPGFLTGTAENWITAFIFAALTCNFIATALLAFRLASIDRSARRYRVGRGLTASVFRVVIDAGALYSFMLLTMLICTLLKNNGCYFILKSATSIISIAFYLIILRLGLCTWPGGTDVESRASSFHAEALTRPVRPVDVHTDDGCSEEEGKEVHE